MIKNFYSTTHDTATTTSLISRLDDKHGIMVLRGLESGSGITLDFDNDKIRISASDVDSNLNTDLDMNGNRIISNGVSNIVLEPLGTGNIQLIGPVLLTGDLDIGSFNLVSNTDSLKFSGNTIISGNTQLFGTTQINGILDINSNVITSIDGGDITLTSNREILLNGDTVISGNITLNGATTLNGNLDVNGNNIICDGNILVLQSNTKIQLSGLIELNGEVDAINGIKLYDMLDVNDNMISTSSPTGVVDITAKNIQLNGASVINGRTTLNGFTQVNGSVVINGSISSDDGNVLLDVGTAGLITLNGEVQLNGNLNVNGNEFVSNGDIVISPNSQIVLNGLTILNGNLDIGSSTVISSVGPLNLSGDTVVTGNLTTKALKINGNLDVNGNEIICSNDGNIVLSTTGTGNVQLDGDTIVNGNMTVNGEITLRGDLDFTSNYIISSTSDHITLMNDIMMTSNGVSVLSTTVKNSTIDATITELFKDGIATRLIVPSNTSFAFEAIISGRRTDVNESAAFKFEGMIDNFAGLDGGGHIVETVAIAGSVKNIITNVPSWDVNVEASNNALVFKVTGAVGATIKWVGMVKIIQIS